MDTIHFAPSKASHLLQAVDLIAFLHRRIQAGDVDERARRADEELWGLIRQRLIHSRCWAP